jgi:excisionase family DNA binding protein
MSARTVSIVLPEEIVEDIASIAAEIVIATIGAGTERAAPALMTVTEAADYLRCKPQRIYDLVSSRRLDKLKDGARTLVRRVDLDAHIGLS